MCGVIANPHPSPIFWCLGYHYLPEITQTGLRRIGIWPVARVVLTPSIAIHSHHKHEIVRGPLPLRIVTLPVAEIGEMIPLIPLFATGMWDLICSLFSLFLTIVEERGYNNGGCSWDPERTTVSPLTACPLWWPKQHLWSSSPPIPHDMW